MFSVLQLEVVYGVIRFRSGHNPCWLVGKREKRRVNSQRIEAGQHMALCFGAHASIQTFSWVNPLPVAMKTLTPERKLGQVWEYGQQWHVQEFNVGANYREEKMQSCIFQKWNESLRRIKGSDCGWIVPYSHFSFHVSLAHSPVRR